MTNTEKDKFRQKVKEEWSHMWKEMYDDKVMGEGIAVRKYPLLLMDRGVVIFASRDAKAPSYSEIMAFWASEGSIYAPDSVTGRWGKFIRTEVRRLNNPRARSKAEFRGEKKTQHSKKGGRGWLHA